MPAFVRQAVMTDLEAIMQLEISGFAPGIVEDRSVFAHRLGVFPEGFYCLELPGTDQPQGYLCAEIWSDDAWLTDAAERFALGHDLATYLDRGGRSLYIASMTIHPSLRGGGWGRILFREVLHRLQQQFPRLDQAVLIVNQHWLSAQALYRREGFQVVTELPEFFKPQTGPLGAALVMTKRLQTQS